MTQQNVTRARRFSIGPSETMVLGLVIAFIGGMIMTDEAAGGVIVVAIGAVMTQIGIIATAVEWAIRRSRES